MKDNLFSSSTLEYSLNKFVKMYNTFAKDNIRVEHYDNIFKILRNRLQDLYLIYELESNAYIIKIYDENNNLLYSNRFTNIACNNCSFFAKLKYIIEHK